MMVCLGATVFTMVGTAGADNTSDVTRVIQGVAAGVGFLGAGTILKLTDKLEVKGLTTAGSIWLAAALGVTIGMKLYTLAIAATLCCLVVLAVLRPLERGWDRIMGVQKEEKTAPDKPATAKPSEGL
jgi:putative Mg2+ transporter-C (MgtC) family protein